MAQKGIIMLRKIFQWTGITMLAFIVSFTVIGTLKKNTGPAESFAQRKAKSAVKCTPETNKNCFNLTIEEVKQIKLRKASFRQ